MAAKKTNITLTKVKSVSKSLNKTEKYEVETGEYAGDTITFYPTFSHKAIEEVLIDLQALTLEAIEKEFEISDKLYMHLIHFLTIKHFTHFKNDIPPTLIGEGKKAGILEWLEHFQETGLYKLIIEEVFLPTEIQKVFNAIINFTSTGIVMSDLEQQMQDRVASLKFKYNDVFEQVGKLGQNLEARNVLANPVN